MCLIQTQTKNMKSSLLFIVSRPNKVQLKGFAIEPCWACWL